MQLFPPSARSVDNLISHSLLPDFPRAAVVCRLARLAHNANAFRVASHRPPRHPHRQPAGRRSSVLYRTSRLHRELSERTPHSECYVCRRPGSSSSGCSPKADGLLSRWATSAHTDHGAGRTKSIRNGKIAKCIPEDIQGAPRDLGHHDLFLATCTWFAASSPVDIDIHALDPPRVASPTRAMSPQRRGAAGRAPPSTAPSGSGLQLLRPGARRTPLRRQLEKPPALEGHASPARAGSRPQMSRASVPAVTQRSLGANPGRRAVSLRPRLARARCVAVAKARRPAAVAPAAMMEASRVERRGARRNASVVYGMMSYEGEGLGRPSGARVSTTSISACGSMAVAGSTECVRGPNSITQN